MCEKEPTKRYSDAECQTLFATLFPAGFAGEDVLKEIAPEGWPHSTLQFLFHPTLEQVHWERVQLHRNLRNWPWFSKKRSERQASTTKRIARMIPEDHTVFDT